MSARGGPPREGFSGMRLPPLIKQLRRILDQYPDDGQILKELIQNAEDGDATVVKILYNGRTSDIHPSLSTSSVLQDIPHLRALQAPGLCVYNDGIFTEDDWEGIRMVQSSVKEQDLHKVGRFGLGFKSVFHLTDVPMIISGENILLIDPHQFEDNHEKVCFMKNLNNIDEFKQALLSVIGGTFGFTEKTIQEGKFEGTLFWFPLRREESELSDNVYGDEKMQDLFQAFREEAPHMLLFLKSLTEIQLFQQNADLFSKHDEEGEVDKEGTLDLLFSVNVSSGNTEDVTRIYTRTEREIAPSSYRKILQLKGKLPPQDVTRIRQEFANSIRELKGKLPPQAIERRYHLTVNTFDSISERPTEETRTWIVIQHHAGSGKMSRPFKKLCFDKEISASPCVGLAVALEDHQTGHIFCFLPLPLETKSPTGLPVHVHGHFALSQNRRHLKWPTADQRRNRAHTDKAIRWNQHLLLDVFPQAYTSLVKELISHWEATGRSESLFQRIYRTLPVVSEVTEQWQGLTKAFFQLLVKEPFLYTPSSGGRLVGLTGAQLLDVSSSSAINDTLVQTAVLCKNTIVPLPRHVCDAIKQYTPNTETLRFVNPETVCDMLRSNDVYSHLTGQHRLNLLEYICTSEDISCLEGVTLLPLANGSFDTFEHEGSVYFCKSEDVAMFPGLENRFVMTGGPTEKYLQKLAEEEIFGIRKLTPESFVTLFKTCMETAFPQDDAVLSEDSDFTLEWLNRVWRYITDQEIDVKTELPDIPLIPGDTLCEPSAELHPVSSTFVCMNIDTVGHIDEAMGSGLRHLGMITLQSIPSVLVKNTSILGDVIKYPSIDGVMKALAETEQREASVECAAKFNQRATPDEKISLVKFLGSCKTINEGVKQLLRKLQLFPTTESSNNDVNVCLDDFSLLEPKEHFDVCYPSVYIRGISGESLALAETLGAKHVTQHEVILGILKLMKGGDKRYTKRDVETFMIFLLENTEFFTSDHILKHARDIKFLPTKENENIFYQAKELFEPHPDLNALFEGEDRIPCVGFWVLN